MELCSKSTNEPVPGPPSPDDKTFLHEVRRAPRLIPQHRRLRRHRRLDDEQVKLALQEIASREEWVGIVCVIIDRIVFSGEAFGEGVGGLSVTCEQRSLGSRHELSPVGGN
jgi:hypothetical protein